MDGWEHMQKLDYKQLPFKCKKFHEYGHIVKEFYRPFIKIIWWKKLENMGEEVVDKWAWMEDILYI